MTELEELYELKEIIENDYVDPENDPDKALERSEILAEINKNIREIEDEINYDNNLLNCELISNNVNELKEILNTLNNNLIQINKITQKLEFRFDYIEKLTKDLQENL